MGSTATTVTDARGVLVIGGGIAGVTTAIEAADAGCDVVLVEREAFLGGRVARFHQYFPKLCPPMCGLEIHFRRLGLHPRVRVLTRARVSALEGGSGRYRATIVVEPRYVTDACTACGDCVKVCPATRTDEFNYRMRETRAIYRDHPLVVPAIYAIDRPACPAGCDACVRACPCGAVDLTQQSTTIVIEVAAIVAATGWRPYDAGRIEPLGFGRCRNVITSVMMERLAAPDGPTGGKIVRPSDGAVPRTVAFVQCAGSRDENHLPYCSAVCCAASLKQAAYVRTACADARVNVYYIDIRTGGRLEEFYARMAADPAIELIKGKVARVAEDASTGEVLLEVEDTGQGRKRHERADLVVLATGIEPQTDGLPQGFVLDEFGFVVPSANGSGLYAAGCVRRPAEVAASVQDATGAALKALQCAVRSARHG
jgi:quinone-modifying oxidoreductase subunit QmoA